MHCKILHNQLYKYSVFWVLSRVGLFFLLVPIGADTVLFILMLQCSLILLLKFNSYKEFISSFAKRYKKHCTSNGRGYLIIITQRSAIKILGQHIMKYVFYFNLMTSIYSKTFWWRIVPTTINHMIPVNSFLNTNNNKHLSRGPVSWIN